MLSTLQRGRGQWKNPLLGDKETGAYKVRNGWNGVRLGTALLDEFPKRKFFETLHKRRLRALTGGRPSGRLGCVKSSMCLWDCTTFKSIFILALRLSVLNLMLVGLIRITGSLSHTRASMFIRRWTVKTSNRASLVALSSQVWKDGSLVGRWIA